MSDGGKGSAHATVTFATAVTEETWLPLPTGMQVMHLPQPSEQEEKRND